MIKNLYLDLETTGVDPSVCAIIQMALIVEIDSDTKESLDIIIRPFEGCKIEPGALAMNDIPKATAEGLLYAQAYKALLMTMEQYVDKYNKTDKFNLIGYNIGFDDRFLREMWSRMKDVYYNSWFWWPPLDVAVLAAQYLRHERRRLENFKLSTVAQYLDIKREGDAHDALSDIRLTKAIYKRVTEVMS